MRFCCEKCETMVRANLVDTDEPGIYRLECPNAACGHLIAKMHTDLMGAIADLIINYEEPKWYDGALLHGE